MTKALKEWNETRETAEKIDGLIKKHNIGYFTTVRQAWRKRRWVALPIIILFGPILIPLVKGLLALVRISIAAAKRHSAESGTEFTSMLPYSVGTGMDDDAEHEPWPTDALLFEKTLVVSKLNSESNYEPIIVFNASGDGPRTERHVVATVPVSKEDSLEGIVRQIDSAIKQHEGMV